MMLFLLHHNLDLVQVIPGSSTIFTGPTRGGDEVFTGTLDLSNSTIDLHNPRITITNVTRSATSTAVTFETSDNITALSACVYSRKRYT